MMKCKKVKILFNFNYFIDLSNIKSEFSYIKNNQNSILEEDSFNSNFMNNLNINNNVPIAMEVVSSFSQNKNYSTTIANSTINNNNNNNNNNKNLLNNKKNVNNNKNKINNNNNNNKKINTNNFKNNTINNKTINNKKNIKK